MTRINEYCDGIIKKNEPLYWTRRGANAYVFFGSIQRAIPVRRAWMLLEDSDLEGLDNVLEYDGTNRVRFIKDAMTMAACRASHLLQEKQLNKTEQSSVLMRTEAQVRWHVDKILNGNDDRSGVLGFC